MAGDGSVIRRWLDLIEAVQAAWGIARGPQFEASLRQMMARVPDLPERLARFTSIKLPNPLSRDAVVGKNDAALTLLPGYWHCHLAPDAILIYRLRNRAVELVLICQHDDIQGKRIRHIARVLGEDAAL